MAVDLETRVDKLEEKVQKLELNINNTLSEIKQDVVEIKGCVKNNSTDNDLKNQIIEKDVERNTGRIKKLEETQTKLLWLLVGELITIIGSVVIAMLQG